MFETFYKSKLSNQCIIFHNGTRKIIEFALLFILISILNMHLIILLKNTKLLKQFHIRFIEFQTFIT